MELTPDLLLEAKFDGARRGYDMAQVDDFLERVADAVEVLLDRLKSEFERAEAAEAALAAVGAGARDGAAGPAEPTRSAVAPSGPTGDAGTVDEPPAPVSDSDGAREQLVSTIAAREADLAEAQRQVEALEARIAELEATMPAADGPSERVIDVDEPVRILVHAQRTAEAVVADAQAEADAIRTGAQEVSERSRAEAQELLDTTRATAEAEARKAGESARRAVQNEVLGLRRDRDALAEDVRGLKRWLDEQRARMRTAARDLQRLVDDPSALRDLPVPKAMVAVGSPDDAEDGTEPTSGEASSAGSEDESPLPEGAEPVVSGAGDDSPTDAGEPTEAVPVVDLDETGQGVDTGHDEPMTEQTAR